MLYPIDRFLDYLKIEKIASKVTLRDYGRELFRLQDYLLSADISDINLISTRILRQYIYHAKGSRNLASSSTAKMIAIIKSFFNYLEEDEIIIKNPSRKIKVPKKTNKIPTVMSKHEVDLIIRSVDFTPLRHRRQAMVIIYLTYQIASHNSFLVTD